RPDLVGLEIGVAASGVADPDQREARLQNTVVGAGSERTRLLDVAYPVFVQGSDVQWGTVRIGLDLEPMHREATRVRFILMGIGVAGVLLALLGARIISRKITASIEDLVRGTIQVSRGNLDHRIEIEADDEISTLAAHFNHMTEQVKKQQDEIAVAKGELEILNATLEEKVSKRTQDFLASEEKYRILVDNSPDPILISQDGVIRFLNPAFETLFGYGMDEAMRREIQAGDLFHPEERATAMDLVDEVMHGADVEPMEFRGVAKDGTVRLFEMRAMRITYMGDRAVELILLDTTEKKELQDHLLQHEKLRALGELASGVAHDFNNILGIILGRAQILQQQAKDDEVRRGLRTIERAAFDGGETVRRIQDFARSRTEQDFSDIDLEALLREVVEITRTRWRDQAELRNVKIDVEMDLVPVENIKGNGSELREVYTNLIFNAVDAMPKGGTIHIAAAMEDDEAVVHVRDTGHGMDESVRARIFDPFFTTKGTNGMGLGMSVVYGIIERHDGKITVESQPNKGTCFTVRIPSCPATETQCGADDEMAVDLSARVLVIDDETDILELMSDILDAGGHEVVTAGSGPEGLQRLEEGTFDLMFCDLGMRGMSGWEVVSAVRANDRGIGIVLLTGWGATLSGDKVEEYGIDAVLNKPFEMRRILETVVEITQRSQARRGAAT
ncbi:response regulator, partial [bacterium]|nr:response regulator [bacterium]